MADPTETELAQQAERERIARESAAEAARAEQERQARIAPEESVVDEPGSNGAARLRAFEDEHFGKNAVRINGRVERGSGSPYQKLPEPKRRHYQALEKLVDADEKLALAHGNLMQADAAHDAALEAVALAEKEADAASDE